MKIKVKIEIFSKNSMKREKQEDENMREERKKNTDRGKEEEY